METAKLRGPIRTVVHIQGTPEQSNHYEQQIAGDNCIDRHCSASRDVIGGRAGGPSPPMKKKKRKKKKKKKRKKIKRKEGNYE